jgi:DNA-3-methyladenine glycosylase II
VLLPASAGTCLEVGPPQRESQPLITPCRSLALVLICSKTTPIACAAVLNMPVTRSITRTRAATIPPIVNVKRAPKRQSESKDPVVTTKRSRTSNSKARAKKVETEGTVPRPLIEPSGEELAPLPAKLIFSLEDAKDHLIRADHRFRDVFSRLPCKPFETLEEVHPFRSVLRGHAADDCTT